MTKLMRSCPNCQGRGRLFALASGHQLYSSLVAPCQLSEPHQSVVLCRACRGSGRQLLGEADLDWKPASLQRHYLGVARGPRLVAA